MKQYFFLSGLPRSGSTVLAAILNQHPDIHASSTSGLLDMMMGTLRAWSDSLSAKSSVDQEQSEKEIRNVLRTIMDAKYEHVEKPIILDKARSWASDVNIRTMGNVLGYKPKIIATVRNIPDCAASFARVAKPENLQDFLRDSELIHHLKQAYQALDSGYRFAPECILFVDYDDLVNDPKTQLKRIHDFLGLSDFEYDLNNLDGTNLRERDEEIWSVKGLHDIKPKLGRSHNQSAKDVLSVFHDDFLQPRFWLNESAGIRPLHKLDIQLAAGLMGNFDDGWKLAKELEKDEPWNHRAAFNRGWYEMWNGNLQAGEQCLYRGRIEKVFGNPPIKTPAPMWDGKSKGTVLLNLEGGLGDQIHGVRYARDIAQRGCQVIVSCSGPLAMIFRQVEGVIAVVQHDAAHGVVHDFWVPSMSALLTLGFEYKDIDGSPYIPRKSFPAGGKKRIGLRWQGNPRFEHEQHRLFPSKFLFDAVQDADAEFISLQRDDGAEHRPSWVKEVPLNTWEETAEAVGSCDLVITSCTSVAHLSASLGVETLIIVPVLPYYLWAKPGQTTEWYDSVRLFRQKSFGEWSAPFAEIKKHLTFKQGVEHADN